MSSLEPQQPEQPPPQKRPTLQFAADAGAGPGTVTGAEAMSPATTPLGSASGFLPDMPQWKKDLIQRRKTNVARTTAAACSPTSAAAAASAAAADGSCATFTEPAGPGAIQGSGSSVAAITSQQQQQHVKRNVNQTYQQQATYSPTTEEKSEKCFVGSGGHQTLPTEAATATAATTATAAQSTQGKDLATAFSVETAASAAAPAVAAIPIPKQRSSLFNTRSQSTGKEQEEILNLDARERERERERACGERDAEVNYASLVYASGRSGEVETGTATTGALTVIASNNSNIGSSADSGIVSVKQTAATAASSSSSANQLETKCKPGHSVAEAALSNFSNNTPIIIDKNCKSKISDKLQSNNFIKNQQQQQQQQQRQLERQTIASPTKVAVKTTMVAMQEMKKTTTQNGQQRHHHHHHHHHHQQQQQQQLHLKSADSDLDGGVAALPTLLDSVDHNEEFSYGPGIVSKLRCRYLNLALRCESRQQSQKQRLQRSTSLNTLLDRNDDDVEDEHQPQQQHQHQVSNVALPVTAAVNVNVTRNAAPPPILSAKPAGSSSYIKSVNVMQQQQQMRQQQMSQEQQSTPAPNGNVLRSRHFKRGNEVMKRARSVEALLCEKSPWNTQRASYQAAAGVNNSVASGVASGPTAVAGTGPTTPTCVTIEDKIQNARERLHSGTDTTPPKRLTSIIDDTERPPPDLVKQTLKMFEASANRRPRAAQRSNGVGGVASKVASYKSIIKEQKPVQSTSIGGSGSSKRDPTPAAGFAASTPKQRIVSANSHASVVPDIIPRQLEPSCAYDSPVTNISKMLERMQLESPSAAQPEVTGVGAITGAGGSNQRLVSDQLRAQTSATATTVAAEETDDGDNRDESNDEGNENEVDGDAAAEADVDDDGDGEGDGDGDGDAEGEGDNDNVCNSVKLGTSGDKLTAATAAPAAQPLDETGGVGGGVQRSFAAALQENAHASSTSSNSRKLPQRKTDNSESTTAATATAAAAVAAAAPSSSTTTTTKQIGVIRPLLNNSSSSSGCSTPLTSREIEKNRINEMKKSTALAADAAAAAAAAAGSTATSLDTVINTKDGSETDAAGTTGISPIWPLRKRRQPTGGANGSSSGIGGGSSHTDNNTSMVFNFSKSSKEVPDYIESDVVIFRRKRELPKPNESGFVLLGDLSVETSTDTDYDDYSMCPPSPCDVEFENANIVIDGKSSIRQKPKDSSFRVQFNDTLTSTFEYPSEASQIIDDPQYADPYSNVTKHHQLFYEEHLRMQHQQAQQQQQHHHVTVDEIIELPTAAAASSASHKSSPTSSMLGNLPLDYPSLGRGIILPQLQPLHQPQAHSMDVPKQQPEAQQQQQRRRRSVLLKPQYACFLQNDAVQPPPHQVKRKAASFSYAAKPQQPQQQQQQQQKEQQQQQQPPQPQSSTALGFYTPVKASPMDTLFQLGVTRTPSIATKGGSYNGNSNGNGSILGISDGLLKDESVVKNAPEAKGTASAAAAADEVDDYLTAGGIVYSEGAQKTDLLY